MIVARLLLRHTISLLRQYPVLTEYDPKRGVAVATLAYEYPPDDEVPEHAHGSDQLIYAISGLMEVSSGQSAWLIPPHFAVWIPARTIHQIRMTGSVSMRTLYLRPGLAEELPRQCAVLAVTPLLRELMIEIVRLGRLRIRHRYELALCEVLIPQLQKASPIPTCITLPRETRALAVAQAILRNPAETQSLTVLCNRAGVSVRTIERVFQKDLGISFELWRRQLRLTKAVELLVSGRSVKEAAFQVGYSQPSALVEIFRKTFGATPKAWVTALGK